MPYPDELDDLRDDLVSGSISAGGTPLDDGTGHADLHNDTSAAVNAVEATLGLNPEGGFATVVARLDALPRGILGYAEVTANQLNVTSEVDLTGLSVTVTAGTSRRLKVTVQGEYRTAASNDAGLVNIKESTTILGRARLNPGAAVHNTFHASTVIAPSAGSHTYKATMVLTAGSGDLDLIAASGSAAFILVEDIGAA